MAEAEIRQAIIDQEHLKLLSIAYLVSAGINAVFSLFGLFYAFMGVLMSTVIAWAPAAEAKGPPPEMGWFFGLFGLCIFLGMMTLAGLKFLAYRRLQQRRSRILCMVIGGVSCAGVPYGTLLGIFTFVVLGRASVAKLFEGSSPPILAPDADASGG